MISINPFVIERANFLFANTPKGATVPEFLAVGNAHTAFLSGSVKGGDQVTDNITAQNITHSIQLAR